MLAGMIDVTGVPLETLVRAAYRPSRPLGLGVFAYQTGDLTDAEVAEIIDRGRDDGLLAISMDYVKGRSCKFRVRRDGDRLLIPNRWHDHSDDQLRDLLTAVGLRPDLVDGARDAERQYIDVAIASAVAFLKERGGVYVEKRDDQLPDELFDGLIYGSDPGPAIKREWGDDGAIYTLADVTRPA